MTWEDTDTDDLCPAGCGMLYGECDCVCPFCQDLGENMPEGVNDWICPVCKLRYGNCCPEDEEAEPWEG